MFFGAYNEMLNDAINGLKKEDIQRLFDLIEGTRNNGEHLFVFGNGRSAATAPCWVYDFDKGVSRGDSKHLKIFSPTNNEAIFSALGNDCGYETTFVERMENFLELGDLILASSVSRSSSNLVEAHQYTKEISAKTACVVADKSSKIISMSDFIVIIPPENYGVVENIHVILRHVISQQIYTDNIGA